MTDPREILDQIQARADAATEGPWTWASHTTVDGDQWAVLDKQDHALAENRDGWGPDAEFIAAARTDVPALVDALQAVLELHKPIQATMTSHGGVSDVTVCDHCLDPTWPCPTVAAITTTLEEDHA